MVHAIEPGSVEGLIAAEVGGRFTIRETTTNLSTTVAEIFVNNPERVGWVIINTGGVEAQFGWTRELTAADSIPFGANGGGMSVNVREDFVLPIFPTFARVGSGTGTLRVVQIIRVTTRAQG